MELEGLKKSVDDAKDKLYRNIEEDDYVSPDMLDKALSVINRQNGYISKLEETILNANYNKGGHSISKAKSTITVDVLNIKYAKKAFAEANNAIYFADKSDYRPALYEVCKCLNPNIDYGSIGVKYIEYDGDKKIQHEHPCKLCEYKDSKSECGIEFIKSKYEPSLESGTCRKGNSISRACK